MILPEFSLNICQSAQEEVFPAEPVHGGLSEEATCFFRKDGEVNEEWADYIEFAVKVYLCAARNEPYQNLIPRGIFIGEPVCRQAGYM